ncbi:hypothetical protein SETIT_5G390900v2 [Setaria italica]|uniref:DUF7148 domain-containing protein n=1 Tax=Setaria italica TaxID=4555 RepID=K3XMA7_SETIT|nr:uncharacterized protein LOC101777882 [Setaria italica]RCV28255.1 hypothetical protein SETIT_5G390900v2 [Setaria italica]
MLLTRLSSSSCSSTALQRHACTTGKPPFRGAAGCWKKREKLPGFRARVAVKPPCAAPGKGGIVPAGNDDDGVSLGTVKLPGNIDVARFESLLFQWGNSLCQGANLPLPVPLKVDKVEGGIRLGFIAVDDGATQTLVYIDCLVSQAPDGSGPVFRAIRNGPMKDKEPPGEPRIMRSLLQALQKSIQIAQV